MKRRLLYVSVKVNQSVGLLAKRIAGQVDSLRSHIGPLVGLAGNRRPGTAIIVAGGRRLADSNRVSVNHQRDAAIAFAPGDQGPALPRPLKAAGSRAVHVASTVSDQSRPQSTGFTGDAQPIAALPRKRPPGQARLGGLFRASGKEQRDGQHWSHIVTLLQL